MERLKRLIIEAHRRSLWQVLGVYLVSSWVVLQVVDTLTGVFGLPAWVPQVALVLLIVGLPIVLATAVVQEGGPVQVTTGRAGGGGNETPGKVGGTAGGREPAVAPGRTHGDQAPATPIPPPSPGRSFLQRHLTWGRAFLGGVAGFAFLGLFAVGYLVSWATGIGPVGSLVAQGEIEEGEWIVLADFRGPSDDPALGDVVTEALRIDLMETPILRALDPSEVRRILALMDVEEDASLTLELAREVALRDGVKAVLGGEIARVGQGYVLTATLMETGTGRSLAGFRATGQDDAEVISAIEELSRAIRNRAGEPLRTVHAAPRLEAVTTSSLPALRRYTGAVRAFNRGDTFGAMELLEEALELDPGFSMAWHRLNWVIGHLEIDRGREMEAATRAFELRHRLSDRERYLAEALYHQRVTFDLEAARRAYHRVLEIDPDDSDALVRLGTDYRMTADYDAAVELLLRAVERPAPSFLASSNLVGAFLGQRRFEEAAEAVEAFAARHPGHPFVHVLRYWVRFLQGDDEGALAALDPLLADLHAPPAGRASAHDGVARVALRRGRIGEAREHLEEAERIARDVPGSFFLLRRLFTAHAEVAVGDPERGVRLLQEASDQGEVDALPPEDHWHFLHAIVHAMAGRPEDGEAWLRRFDEEVPPEFHDVFHVRNDAARAQVALAADRPEAALRILEDVRARRLCRICYAEWMGKALWEIGRLEEAAEEWERYLRAEDRIHALEWTVTQGLWVLQRIGPLYEELGDTDRALHHYRRLADLWAEADEELQPVVRHAWDRIAALEEALIGGGAP